jgi:hypothetical protein
MPVSVVQNSARPPSEFGICRHQKPSRLLTVCEEASRVLAYIGFLPPKSIGLETAQNLIGACLHWHNESCPIDASDERAYAANAFFVEYAKLDIGVATDGPSRRTGRLCVTAVSLSEVGPYVAYMLGFSLPTWELLASALERLNPSSDKLACLGTTLGGTA